MLSGCGSMRQKSQTVRYLMNAFKVTDIWPEMLKKTNELNVLAVCGEIRGLRGLGMSRNYS